MPSAQHLGRNNVAGLSTSAASFGPTHGGKYTAQYSRMPGPNPRVSSRRLGLVVMNSPGRRRIQMLLNSLHNRVGFPSSAVVATSAVSSSFARLFGCFGTDWADAHSPAAQT